MSVNRTLLPVVACLLLGACSGALRWAPESHVVRSGDTVYSIAFRYGIDQRDLIGWNKLNADGLIFQGQRLRLSPPNGYTASRSAPPRRRAEPDVPVRRESPPARSVATRVSWRWPSGGRIIAGFGGTAKTQSGVHIAGKRGEAIRAAAGGEVVYAGSGLPGYGQLLIIKHTADFLSAYGHNESLLVGEGDRVQGGQVIARMGDGPGQRPLLHFEIRRAGQPVNPLGYLPRR